jgi:hypothetical protein
MVKIINNYFKKREIQRQINCLVADMDFLMRIDIDDKLRAELILKHLREVNELKISIKGHDGLHIK